ncbi:transposase [Listeria monocytogenes]|uniref:helix-turn-helix domain-containing protein n=1 Tax=Listeria monocytogenes TaxID=1639 RepID=UPI000A1D3D6F|nr:helix-turn-helix domain-containing protein [Listeria monocytogenes]ARM73657.1 transposase [Listeria monocytogenes]
MTINKTSFEQRLFVVQEILEKKKSRNLVSKETNIPNSTIRDWVQRYQNVGEDGLRPYKTRVLYTAEVKKNAVEEILYQGETQRAVMRKYNISPSYVLRTWISTYNKKKELKSTGRRCSLMSSRRPSAKTTQLQRMEMVQYTLEHELDYQATMKKYGVSYQQIYTWVKKYTSLGIKGLQDKRGRNKPIEEMSELDQLRLENKRLRHRNEFLEMDRELAKKLRELKKRYSHFH